MNDIIEFFTDPLRLTLLVAGVVVVLGIVIFGRRSHKMEAKLYHSHSNRDFKFNNPPPDLLVDEEIIVLPPRKKESDVKDAATASEPQVAEFSAGGDSASVGETESAKVEIKNMENLNDEIPMETFEYQQDKSTEKSAPASQESALQNNQVAGNEKPVKIETERFIVFHVLPAAQETFKGSDIHQVASALGLAYGMHGVYHFPADTAREGNSQFCLVNMTAEGNFDKDTLPTLETRGVSLILRLTEKTKDGLTLFSNMLAIAQGMARRLGGEIQDQTRVPLTPEIVTALRSDIAQFHTKLNQRTPVTEV